MSLNLRLIVLASLAVCIHSAFGQCSSMAFAHLVDGGGWKSSIYLINGSATAKANYTLTFRGDRGQPVLMSLIDGRRDNQISGTVAPGGIALLETPGVDTDGLGVASATLSTTGTLSGFAVIRERQAGGPDREATVPLGTPAQKGLSFPFDNTAGFVSSIALSVPCGGSTAGVGLTATAVDESGAPLGHCDLKTTEGGHLAFVTTEQIPGTKEKRGVIRITTSVANVYLSGVGLRFTPAGALTTLPPYGLPATAAIAMRAPVRVRAKKR